MSRESAVVAGEANGDKKQWDEQTMSDGVKAALDIALVRRAGKHISQKIGSGNAGHAA